jgi:hypothetical protein
MRMKVALTSFEVLHEHLPEGSEENDEIFLQDIRSLD